MNDKTLHKEKSLGLPNNPDSLSTAYKQIELALSSYKLGYYTLDLVTGEMEASDLAKANYGLLADAPFNRDEEFRAILPQHRGYVQKKLDTALADHQQYVAEYEVAWPDGSVHWIKATGLGFYD